MATNDESPQTLRAVPRGEVTALGRPGDGRTSALQAYVLHTHDWSETSLIVELFTRSQGRIVVAAKGAKRPTSNFRAVLLPFQPLLASLGKAPVDEHAEIFNLRGAEWAGGQPLLAAAALFSGFYANELLLKLLARQDPHPALFDAYADTLAALGEGGDEGAALRAFELVLLRELGWLPELDVATLTAAPLAPEARYTLTPEGGVIAQADGLPGSTWVALEAALAHQTEAGSAAALRAACAPSAPALRGPLRELLHYHLGAAPLRTRQVWQGVQRLADPR
ncbi:MAG: DNA repair protein RecO [Leptothrix sp. (in: Bacteria)]|nr:DNA repair protein RecO [Leptothrix sp. (in: b-proteobacteria)]